MLNDALKKVMAGGVLTETESAAMVEALANGENPTAAAGLLTALSLRGESVSEMTGAAGFLRNRMTGVDAGDCSDIVGTGGDGDRIHGREIELRHRGQRIQHREQRLAVCLFKIHGVFRAQNIILEDGAAGGQPRGIQCYQFHMYLL